MCNPTCVEFGTKALTREAIAGAKVIEVGSYNVNGSLRQIVEPMGPTSYIGVDIATGPGVDEVCSVYDLVARFGPESFDVVISTELYEHVRDWRAATSQLKRILRPGGVILMSTRSHGFPYHGYPYDFWRFEPEDMHQIFSDMEGVRVDRDSWKPGVFMAARKPLKFHERVLDDIELYSIVSHKRCRDISPLALALLKVRMAPRQLASKLLPAPVKAGLRRLLSR